MTSEQLLIQFEKEERRERNVKILALILFFLTMTFALLSFALRPVTAHAMTRSFEARDSQYSVTIPDDLYKQYPYCYIIYNSYSSGEYWIYLTDSKLYSADKQGHLVSNADFVKWELYNFSPASTRNFVIDSTKRFNHGDWRNCSSMIFENGSGSCCITSYDGLIYSNTNIQYASYDHAKGAYTVSADSFFIPPTEVVAKMAVELPAVVKVNLKMILPIAVFCLACLIGLVVLRKGLRTFQH